MMTKKEYLGKLKFNSFERYPPQLISIYLKCEGVEKGTKRRVCKYIRANQFNAATFNPEVVRKVLKDKNMDWVFSWYPAEEIDSIYDNDDFNQCNADNG